MPQPIPGFSQPMTFLNHYVGALRDARAVVDDVDPEKAVAPA